LLHDLFFDQTRYVTRSVANHLNDISKKDPELVYEMLQKWKNSGKQNPQEMDFIIKHSLRTLVKKGENNALEMIGVSQNPQVEKLNFLIHNKHITL
jgi:3-methyladenine DNA glycosylase AlkC